MPTDRASLRARRERAAEAARAKGVGALLVVPGSDLLYLAGYRIHSSERLTCLVVDADGAARLVVPELEAPRARAAAPDLELRAWSETEDPFAIAATLIPRTGAIAVDDRMWAAFVLRLQRALPDRELRPASEITAPLRSRKESGEIEALRSVAAAADRTYGRARDAVFLGRSEREVASDLARLLRDEGHEEVSFTIVASGPNGASPHHEAGDRRIAAGDAVVLDFGGTRDAYCSDITRTVHVGRGPEPEVQRVHDVVRRAQEAAYAAAVEGTPASRVDRAARSVIEEAGYGERFVHRTGHGIGLDGHEHPYLVAGNDEPLAPGMTFSLEPGVYIPGRFGVRIEDIVVLSDRGTAEPLNEADRSLAIVA